MMNAEARQLWVSAVDMLLSFGGGYCTMLPDMGWVEADVGGVGDQGRQADKQHTENMRALEAIIERTGGSATPS